jgi:ankyrin repeat protein
MFEVNGLIKEKTIALLAVLAEGAEVNSRDDSGKTPLHAAVRQGHQEIVIPNLVIDCRLPQLVIPAKAGNQAFQLYYI